MKITVLPPHGFIRLVSYMQPVPTEFFGEEAIGIPDSVGRDPGSWTGDLEIVRNARVSFDADWRTGLTVEHEATCLSLLPEMSNGKKRDCDCKPRVVSDAKLIKYLWSHEHTSPFESMVFTFEVKAPIFVFRQWHRHRTWSYNEVSARYTELPEEYWLPTRDTIGTQSRVNKQGRVLPEMGEDEILDIDLSITPQDYAQMADEKDRKRRMAEGFALSAESAYRRYRDRLGEGCPREVARTDLPLSMYSRMFATVDLHNLFHFLALRDHPHAQHEIRVYAQAIKELIRPIVPVALGVFESVKWVISEEDLEPEKKPINIIEHDK